MNYIFGLFIVLNFWDFRITDHRWASVPGKVHSPPVVPKPHTEILHGVLQTPIQSYVDQSKRSLNLIAYLQNLMLLNDFFIATEVSFTNLGMMPQRKVLGLV